ncbi:hypothetical protein B0H16DRAFT_1459741 [Mycena metata]|uniref:Uncharacterized protein n=1 Tax=Mycena metata TaxID=1033252 RepID=A0AAD7NBB8_9AGAR|nr:hypothetical protein B0H16DRAFT_1459741 [Mycena metata]
MQQYAPDLPSSSCSLLTLLRVWADYHFKAGFALRIESLLDACLLSGLSGTRLIGLTLLGPKQGEWCRREGGVEWGMATKWLTGLQNRPRQTECSGGQAWDKRLAESIWERLWRTDNPFLLRGRMEICANEAGQLE